MVEFFIRVIKTSQLISRHFALFAVTVVPGIEIQQQQSLNDDLSQDLRPQIHCLSNKWVYHHNYHFRHYVISKTNKMKQNAQPSSDVCNIWKTIWIKKFVLIKWVIVKKLQIWSIKDQWITTTSVPYLYAKSDLGPSVGIDK